MSVISNFIVISLFLNELSSNLLQEVKSKKKENCKHIYLYIFCLLFAANKKKLTQILVIFSQTRVKNRVTIGNSFGPW